ncbi:hypothetical protein Mal15_56320 [Stieleria maiorica]|uniref:Uncharacterized protein n=1 Tax=Stieleria maiorica TaxID=2795974 RepID=A0A5B9MP98_9BACT|nr:hypothetical protein Mal15_56320 [Stieleria maiorica]
MVASLDYSPRSAGIELRGGLGSRKLPDSEYGCRWDSPFIIEKVESRLSGPEKTATVYDEQMSRLIRNRVHSENLTVRARQ